MPAPTPPTGPTPSPKGPPPKGPAPQAPKMGAPASSEDTKYAFLLDSPFAKMFRATGAMPTVKEIRAIINGILMNQISQIKQQDAEWKKAMQKIKREIEGDDD